MCLFISYVFPLILNNFFISQEKSTMNLVILILTSGVIIVLSYSVIRLVYFYITIMISIVIIILDIELHFNSKGKI